MKLTDDDFIILPEDTTGKIHAKLSRMKEILDDYEKARILDRLELEPADLPAYVDECKKLRELIEKELDYFNREVDLSNEMYRGKDVRNILQKLLEESRK